MAKEYERDPNTFVLTARGRAERNADRRAVTKAAKDNADRLRRESTHVSGEGAYNYIEDPGLGVTIREPDPVYDAADAATAGYGTVREWIEAGKPE